ncbi:LacI family DNA-binding transcriptional regulator [Sinorhizobium medicae]|nr:substrate-binding domain-containing protein [Sinorhizobium medicae]ABR61148.1 Alanine racemase [Sinorhizobium medicae WSM419]MBO1943479.1 LacI family DNA-binding transcriptional regulator [Sinorhizobium medicae]MBO1959151.1 LacI family DNA-binding transcriptional regulator [Sinorhizobium medicae]MDX0405637.1 LacI family DNA-binding transcriptional regulator [Sinorhizobium medicae]MDX0411157.1 LacI family DNA-binding transcriptional regulator [Sinorhizobium medicae]
MSTIAKVAARAGVSPTTVSHVINHSDRVSKPLRERVEAAIKDLGYKPNPQAQSLRTGRTNIVAMLIPDIRNPFYPELVKAAQSELEVAGLDMLIFNTDVPGGQSQDHGREYLRQIGNKRVDGLIVGDFALHGMHDALMRVETPTVFIGNLPNHAVDCVRIDDFGGGYQMGAYLAGKGHRRIAHVTGPSFFAEAMSRADGFEQGLADHGATPDPGLRFEGSYLAPSGKAAAEWLLAGHGGDLPSAVFFGNYLMAAGALAEFYDRGIRIPDDFKVAVFGDQPQLEYVRPRLTRVGNAPAELARRATRMLLERINGTYEGEPRSEVVSCVLREFETA